MMLLQPRLGFELAWTGECLPEPGRRTDREFAPVLDMLEELESSPATRLPTREEDWAPITSELLTRIRDGLRGR